jgi:DNA-binding NarL/FixJ family response regulator
MIYYSDEFRTEFVHPVSSFAQKTYNAEARQETFRGRPKLCLIGMSPLLKECLLQAFLERGDFETTAFPDVDDPTFRKNAASYHLVVLFVPGMQPRRSITLAKNILEQVDVCPPVAVIADSEDTDEVLAAFALGVKAYIPTSVTFDVMTEAIKLGIAGGTYYPSCILSACANGRDTKHDAAYALTRRELAVLAAVRQGRPNKIIAEELGISESTIKVHVHRIMKKLKVQNRTQAAIHISN